MGHDAGGQDDNTFRAFMNALYNTIDAPVTYFRGKVANILIVLFCYVRMCELMILWYYRKDS